MVKFNEGARLDTSQVSDRRGSGGGGGLGGGGFALPIGRAGGGVGLIVVLVMVAIQLFGGKFGGGSSSDAGAGSGSSLLQQAASTNGTVDGAALSKHCQTGADANSNEDCRAVAYINSVQDFWGNQFQQSGRDYPEAITVFYSGQTQTGCGVGQSGMGPFYCPADSQVYIDLSFWNDLKTQFQSGGVFAEGYVIAHEYGHHVQHLLGTSDNVGQATGPDSGSVRLELQADCYAGAWAKGATTTPGEDGEILIEEITDADIQEAVDTAGHIGDDWIQANLGGGQVDESQFSHGSAEQRQKWFTTGYSTGDPAACNTFDTDDLG